MTNLTSADVTLRRSQGDGIQETWGRRRLNKRELTHYDVLDGTGKVLGHVYEAMVTFDRKPRGSRIVTARWRSPRWYWSAAGAVGRRPFPRETRKRALEDLLDALTTKEHA